jgi:hypothetical protein
MMGPVISEAFQPKPRKNGMYADRGRGSTVAEWNYGANRSPLMNSGENPIIREPGPLRTTSRMLSVPIRWKNSVRSNQLRRPFSTLE